MPWTRRDLLRAASALATVSLVPSLPGCTAYDPGPDYVYDGAPADRDLFTHAVASGDPLTDSVILWTRVDLAEGERLEVYVEVHATEAMDQRVAATFLEATAERGGCVKVDISGLRPGRTYHYRFRCMDQTSPVGRTRTAPARGRDPLRMGVASCSNYSGRWFHLYRFLAEQDVHLIAHLGDYIYEYAGAAGPRAHEPPRECITLADYRLRYAQYRSDPDLAEAHRQHPWVLTWDDHETANNAWADGADAHGPNDGAWVDRLDAARQAWFEWLPVREGPEATIYRRLGWGELVTFFVLDTRITGRDQQIRDPSVITQPDRQLLGETQEAWLIDGIVEADTDWVLLLQQVVMAPWGSEDVRPLNEDAWDGYTEARERVLEACATQPGVLVLTGDVHSSWANDLPIDIRTYETEGAVAVEAVTPAITSSGRDLGDALDLLVNANPHIHYAESTRQGCILLEVGPDEARAEWWHLPEGAVDAPEFVAPELAKAMKVVRGTPRWVEA